jgi:hypothetical protein
LGQNHGDLQEVKNILVAPVWEKNNCRELQSPDHQQNFLRNNLEVKINLEKKILVSLQIDDHLRFRQSCDVAQNRVKKLLWIARLNQQKFFLQNKLVSLEHAKKLRPSKHEVLLLR